MEHKQSQGHLVNSHYTRIIICASKYFSPTSLSVLDHLRKKKPKATTLSVCLSVRPSVSLSLSHPCFTLYWDVCFDWTCVHSIKNKQISETYQ